MSTRIPYHPYAELLPMMTAAERAELKALVAREGQRKPIVLDVDADGSGGILDGRNRYEVCLELGLTPRTRPYDPRPTPAGDGPDRLAFVLAENVARRHLNESQRAMVAAKAANLSVGRPRNAANLPDFPADANAAPSVRPRASGDLALLSQDRAAERLNVSPRSVRAAKTVLDKAAPELRAAVERGHLAVSAAAKAAAFAPHVQQRIADEAACGKANAARTVIKQEARAAREQKLGGKIAALPQEKFGLIVEDFEWDHETWSEAGKDRHAGNHYPTARDAHSADEIVARTAERFACAAEACVLVMWATVPHLAIALDVLRARGFAYKSHYVWCKEQFITGYWSRVQHEILLIGTRGEVVPPAMGTQGSSLIQAPRGRHSAKPDAVMAMLDRFFPHTPRLELNARRRRPGWQAWGNEVTPGDPALIGYERAALARGLIAADGMVFVPPQREGPSPIMVSASVPFDIVTADEWRALLAPAGDDDHPLPSPRSDSLRADHPPPQAGRESENAGVGEPADLWADAADPLDIPNFLRRQA